MAKSTNITLQAGGQDYDISNIGTQVRKLVKRNHKGINIEALHLYLKAEDATVYYVLNGEIEGSCALSELA